MHFPESDRRAERWDKGSQATRCERSPREGSTSTREFKRAGKVENVTKERAQKRTTLRTNAAVCSHSMGVCVCVCVCKGVCGGSEVVIDENNDRLAGTGQSETGAIITLWTSRGAFKLLFEKHLERDDSAVCISACTVCEGVRWRGANALCVYVCVCVCMCVCVCVCVCANKSD